MELFRNDKDLAATLVSLRPTPRPAFAAELDERVAAGFPRRSPRAISPLSGLVARLRAFPTRRLALSAGATALAAIAVVTVVIASSEPNTGPSGSLGLSHSERPQPLPESRSPLSGTGSSHGASPQAGGSSASGEAAGTHEAANTLGSKLPAPGSPSDAGPFASKAGHRDVERSAEMVLGADPTDVAGDATAVFDAMHSVDGIVLSSSVTGGAAGDAGARFDLLIPAAKLGDALAAFSAIDFVVSRHEATDDITAPTVRLGEQLRDSRATIDGLLVQLAGADNDEERAEVEVELHTERRHAAALRSQATKLDRRANLSRVSLRIETGAGATSSDESGDWGIGDALGDAGHILAIAAGVAIVGLAVIAPLALIALLIWLANRARIRRGRERALA